MTITELTPPPAPVERKFSIEFTEDEMKALGIIMGYIPGCTIKEWIGMPWSDIPSPEYSKVDGLHSKIYFAIVDIFSPKLL